MLINISYAIAAIAFMVVSAMLVIDIPFSKNTK
mgnify:FL=1